MPDIFDEIYESRSNALFGRGEGIRITPGVLSPENFMPVSTEEITGFRQRNPDLSRGMDNQAISMTLRQIAQSPNDEAEFVRILARAEASTSESFWRNPFSAEAIAETTSLNPLTFIPIREIQRNVAAFEQGLARGGYVEPWLNITEAFASMFEAWDNDEVGRTIRGWGTAYERSTDLEQLDDYMLYDAGNFAGMLAPSALTLIASGGASAPMVAYFALQGFGSGIRDYREEMISRGLEPDAVDAIIIGAGYGIVEVAAEKLGLDLIGRIGAKAAGQIGDLFLRRDAAAAGRLVSSFLAGATVEGTEELITQAIQNGIAANGLWYAPGFDSDRSITDGIGQAFMMGAIGGGLLTAPAMFSPRGRQEMSAGFRSALLTVSEQELATRARQDVNELAGVELPTEPVEAEVSPTAAELSGLRSVIGEMRETLSPGEQAVADAIVRDIESETLEQEVRDAVEERVEPEGDLVQREEAPEGGPVAEAERGDRVVEGRQEQEVTPQQEVTAEDKARFLASIPARMSERQEPTITERAALRAVQRSNARLARELDRKHKRETVQEVRAAVKADRERAKQREQSVRQRRSFLKSRILNIKALSRKERQQLWGKLESRSFATDAALGKAVAAAIQEIDAIFTKRARDRASSSFQMLTAKKPNKRTPRGVNATAAGQPVRVISGTRSDPGRGLLPKYQQQVESALADVPRKKNGDVDTSQMSEDEANRLADRLDEAVTGHALERAEYLEARAEQQRGINRIIASEITGTHGERFRDPVTGVLDPAKSRGLLDFVAGLGTQTLETMVERLSGADNTITHDVLFAALIESSEMHKRGYFEGRDFMLRALEEAGVVVGSPEHIEMSKIIARRQGKWNAVVQGITDRPFRQFREGEKLRPTVALMETGVEGLVLSSAEYIDLLMQFQDPETMALIEAGAPVQITNGRAIGLSQEDINTIRSNAGEREISIANKLVEYINGPLKERMREWSIRTLGYDNTRPDTYVPRERGNVSQPEPQLDEFQPSKLKTITDRIGITRERTQDITKPIRIRDGLARFETFVWKSEGVTQAGDAIMTARSVLANQQVVDAIDNSSLGPDFRKAVQDIITRHSGDILRSIVVDRAFADKSMQRFLGNVNVGLLQINPRIAIFQAGSYYGASTEIPLRYLNRSVLELGALGINSADAKEAWQRMVTASATLRFRDEGSVAARTTESASIAGRGRVAGVDANDQGLMGMIHHTDRWAIVRIWRAAELMVEEQVQRGIVPESERADATRRLAERAVNRTQPTFDTLTTTLIGQEARESPAKKVFTMFRSARSKVWDNTQRAWIRYYRVRQDENASQGQIDEARVRLMTTVTYGLVTNSVYVAAVRAIWDWVTGGAADDDDEPLAEAVARNSLDTLLGLVIGGEAVAFPLQRLINTMQEDPRRDVFQPTFSPVGDIIVDVFSGTGKMIESAYHRDPERAWSGFKDWFTASLVSQGLPGGAFRMVTKELEDNVFED